jgi:predicted anti-sigma-YlaC factor YlaD
MTNLRELDQLLRAADSDAGCEPARQILHAYVDLELTGQDPALTYPGTAIHLQGCPGCSADYEGLREAARRFGGARPQ